MSDIGTGKPCYRCGGTGEELDLGKKVRSLIKVLGREKVRSGLKVSDSMLYSLLNGSREWNGKHLEGLRKLQMEMVGETGISI